MEIENAKNRFLKQSVFKRDISLLSIIINTKGQNEFLIVSVLKSLY